MDTTVAPAEDVQVGDTILIDDTPYTVQHRERQMELGEIVKHGEHPSLVHFDFGNYCVATVKRDFLFVVMR
jgi:hypothetical protein